MPITYGYQHMEQRTFRWYGTTDAQSCMPGQFPESTSTLYRHFFYYCGDTQNYELFKPSLTGVPACKRKTGTKIFDKQPKGDCCSVGNPINLVTGQKYQRERDYVGAGALPLVFERHYSGGAWSTTYSRAIVLVQAAPGWSGHPQPLYSARVVRDDGRVLIFDNLQNETQWQGDADVVARLQGVYVSGVLTGWTYRTEDDDVETYDVDGRLLSIRTRAGLTQTMTRDAQGRLIGVTDPHGRQLTLAYDVSGRLACLRRGQGQEVRGAARKGRSTL